jgi:hypothetical protein
MATALIPQGDVLKPSVQLTASSGPLIQMTIGFDGDPCIWVLVGPDCVWIDLTVGVSLECL